MADNTFNAPLSPIQRNTPSQNLLSFTKNEQSIYNKYSPYYQAGGDIGPNQPYIYTKLTDSNFQKNLTRYDTYAAPIGSTARDVIRMTKFSVSGTGVIHLGKQLLLQQQNPFNETRIYNPLSLLKATARPGTLGLMDYPERHLETSGGLLNFFKDALLSTVGISTKDANRLIDGTASSANTATGNLDKPYSKYADKRGGAKYGLLRYGTASKAVSNFNEVWVNNAGKNNTGGKFLQTLASGLVDKLRKMIPSTNPMGAFGGSVGETWKYRPEYEDNKEGIYYSFLEDRGGLLTAPVYREPQLFYNDISSRTGQSSGGKKPIGELGASDYHKYYPSKDNNPNDLRGEYASPRKIKSEQSGEIGITDYNTDPITGRVMYNNIKDTYSKMLAMMGNGADTSVQFRMSAERYTENANLGINSINNYNAIPNGTEGGKNLKFVEKSTVQEGPFVKYLKDIGSANELRIDNRGFAKASTKRGEIGTEDTYNMLQPTADKNEIYLSQGSNQSKDIIFFYFYDIINKMYIPFRATLGGIQDQHSPQWDEIKYMGRADSLYIYKGFTRDVSFNFKVYANSIKELVPMWKRINYLTGLTRPSKYTDKAYVTNEDLTELDSFFDDGLTTGDESGFIYPPMINFRVGDLYVDQPAILRSVNVSVPDDAHWETLRDDVYKYVYGVKKDPIEIAAPSRQLPNLVDVSVQMSILEKEKSKTTGNHFGPKEGWNNPL